MLNVVYHPEKKNKLDSVINTVPKELLVFLSPEITEKNLHNTIHSKDFSVLNQKSWSFSSTVMLEDPFKDAKPSLANRKYHRINT